MNLGKTVEDGRDFDLPLVSP